LTIDKNKQYDMNMDNDTQATGVDEPTVVDTSETQPSEASSPVSNEAPEATQGIEETEVKAEDTAEEKLYAGKYKTVEDMEKAYKELQTKATKDAMQKADMAKAITSTLDAQADEAAQINGYETDPIVEKVDRLERKDAVTSFMLSHSDAKVEAMDEVLKTDPIVATINSYQGRLEYAYLKSKNMVTNEAVVEAQKKGAAQAQAKILEKQTAQVETARKAEQTDQDSELYERATGNYSMEDRDAARREYIRRNLVNL
jgi:hypothetical protein